MLVVLDYSSEIDAGLQTHEPSDAFMVEWLEVAPDGVSCFQDGLSLLVVGREQVELDRPTFQGFFESDSDAVSLRCRCTEEADPHSYPTIDEVDRPLRESVIIVEMHDVRDELTDDVGGELWRVADDYLQGAILEEPLIVQSGSPGDVKLRDARLQLDPGALIARERLEVAPVGLFGVVGRG